MQNYTTLNFSDITSKFRIVFMFVFVNIKTFHLWYIPKQNFTAQLPMVHYRILEKPKATYKIRAATTLFYILQNNKSLDFSKNYLPHEISGPLIKWR
jgi:hypothetical protein